MALIALGALLLPLVAKPLPVEAFLYSTMPSTLAHAPELAMDGNPKTSFKSYSGMSDGDGFTVILGRPIPINSLRLETGSEGANELHNASLEVSNDGEKFTAVADFDESGVAEAKKLKGEVLSFRVRMKPRRAASHLQISEIKIDSPVSITRIQRGPGRGFVDVSRTPDLAEWARVAELKMESFWAETQALLYTDNFITPNAIYVVYEVGPRVTPVAATGGGKMQVNGDYARQHPDDTGLVVHEAAHAIQSGGSPGWLIEAVADYVRWIKYEPENFTYNVDVNKPDMHAPYRAGAAFLAWCELHYCERLGTKLNEATRFGTYNDGLFEKFCGKPMDVLYKEFLAAYIADKPNLLKKPVPAGMKPRPLPTVSGASLPTALGFNAYGIFADGARFAESGGFDGGGASYSSRLLGSSLTAKGVTFQLGEAGKPNILVAQGQTISLSGKHGSVWILASAVDGGQREQSILVKYADGTTAKFVQNFSDWFEPSEFPGESIAKKTEYRNMADGSRDPRIFYVYSYGFALDATKDVVSITLPNNPNIRVMGVSVAD